jgi:hypothetical protein
MQRHWLLTGIVVLLGMPGAAVAQETPGEVLAPPAVIIDFGRAEGHTIVGSRENLQRTTERLRQADLAVRIYIRSSMEAVMQGHQEGFALFENWYRRRDARLREEAAKREVVANICGKVLPHALDFVVPGSGVFVKTLRTSLTFAYNQAATHLTQFAGGDPDLFIAAQREALERIRSSFLAQADQIPNQQANALETLKWEFLYDLEETATTSTDLSPRVRQMAAHYGIPAPDAATLERVKLSVLESHISGALEADSDFMLAARTTSGFSVPYYLTAIARINAYRQAFAGQPDRYCPVEIRFLGLGLGWNLGAAARGAGRECTAWASRHR